MNKYKLVFYEGENIDLKTKFSSGKAFFAEDKFVLDETTNVSIPFTDIDHVELFRLNGLGRMIRLKTKRNSTIYLTVVRLNIAGLFVIINFLATGKVFKLLKSNTNK